MIAVPSQVLEELARAFGVQAAQCIHFSGGREDSDGVIYRFPYQADYRLMKIMAIPASEQREGLFCLEERFRFSRFMGENGARIVFPQYSPQGRLYEMAALGEHVWVAYSMEIIPGKVVSRETWDSDFFHAWGALVGRLHRLAGQYPSWLSSVNPQTGAEQLTWQQEWDFFDQLCKDDEVRAEWQQIRRKLEDLPRDRGSFGFIHNDPHIFNLQVDNGQITLLDFDVASHFWFAADIATACQHILFSQSGGMEGPLHHPGALFGFLESFLQGYRTEHNLASFWLDTLDLFIAYRRILLYTVMYGWIQTKPAIHAAWRSMILTHPVLVGKLSERPG